jgi:hypothetical protein
MAVLKSSFFPFAGVLREEQKRKSREEKRSVRKKKENSIDRGKAR